MGREGDLSDFENGVVIGARQASLRVSETAELLGISQNHSPGFRENCLEKRKQRQFRR